MPSLTLSSLLNLLLLAATQNTALRPRVSAPPCPTPLSPPLRNAPRAVYNSSGNNLTSFLAGTEGGAIYSFVKTSGVFVKSTQAIGFDVTATGAVNKLIKNSKGEIWALVGNSVYKYNGTLFVRKLLDHLLKFLQKLSQKNSTENFCKTLPNI